MFPYLPTPGPNIFLGIYPKSFSVLRRALYWNIPFEGLMPETLAESTEQPPGDKKGTRVGKRWRGPGKVLKEEMEKL